MLSTSTPVPEEAAAAAAAAAAAFDVDFASRDEPAARDALAALGALAVRDVARVAPRLEFPAEGRENEGPAGRRCQAPFRREQESTTIDHAAAASSQRRRDDPRVPGSKAPGQVGARPSPSPPRGERVHQGLPAALGEPRAPQRGPKVEVPPQREGEAALLGVEEYAPRPE